MSPALIIRGIFFPPRQLVVEVLQRHQARFNREEVGQTLEFLSRSDWIGATAKAPPALPAIITWDIGHEVAELRQSKILEEHGEEDARIFADTWKSRIKNIAIHICHLVLQVRHKLQGLLASFNHKAPVAPKELTPRPELVGRLAFEFTGSLQDLAVQDALATEKKSTANT